MSTFSVSPSVNVSEFDLGRTIPNIASIKTGVCGNYSWGPCFERVQIDREETFRSMYGLPTDSNHEHWHSVGEHLKYSNNIWVVRAVDPTVAKNSGIAVAEEGQPAAVISIGTNPYIPNSSSIPAISFSANQKLKIVARYPGSVGNTKIRVALTTADDFASANIYPGLTFKEFFDYAPVSNAYDRYDQLAIVVLIQNDLDPNWTIVEKYLVDMDPTAKDVYNKSTYIENVINQKSNWIYAFDNITIEYSPKSFEATYLSGGVDGTPSDGDIENGYDYFANSEEIDVSILIDGGNTASTVVQGYISDIATSRRDCVAVLNVPGSDVIDVTLATAISNCVTYRNSELNKNSSYTALYANWKKMYDKYNDVERWVPLSGDIAGIYARTSTDTEDWYAPAGYNRGQIKNCIKLAISPTKSYRDTLYAANINPIVYKQGEGPVVLGQKTLLAASSPFDRVNVRRLFIVLEKSISTAARGMLFEQNTIQTRNYFKLLIDPFLRKVQARNGIFDFQVICDETNNTPTIIDNGEFIGDIYIKPTRAIEFIQLNFIAVATGINFNEILRSN